MSLALMDQLEQKVALIAANNSILALVLTAEKGVQMCLPELDLHTDPKPIDAELMGQSLEQATSEVLSFLETSR